MRAYSKKNMHSEHLLQNFITSPSLNYFNQWSFASTECDDSFELNIKLVGMAW